MKARQTTMRPAASNSKTKILWDLLGDRRKASSRVRAYWVDQELIAKGVASEYRCSRTIVHLLRTAVRMRTADAVVFQKQYSRWHVLLARGGRLLGKTVILDLDDAPSRSQNPRTLRNVERMMRACSAVTVGCRNLRDYARHFNENSVLIPSCIKFDEYELLRESNRHGAVTLGWIGNGAHYAQDLAGILVDPLRRVAAEQSLRFRIVGACGEPRLAEAFGSIPNLNLELVDQIDWAAPGATRKALEGVDIGLYPLLDNEINRYKCGFKALEYMALGLPVIASPVSANSDIVRDGADGRLCSTATEWTRALQELTRDCSLRRKMGMSGRARVEAEYSTKVAATSLLELIREKRA